MGIFSNYSNRGKSNSVAGLTPSRQSRLYDSDEEYKERTPTNEIIILGPSSMYFVPDANSIQNVNDEGPTRKNSRPKSRLHGSSSTESHSSIDSQHYMDGLWGVNHLYNHYGQQLDYLWEEREKSLEKSRPKKLILDRFTTIEAIVLGFLFLGIISILIASIVIHVPIEERQPIVTQTPL